MARKTVAVLLSALVFPGLGQVYKGEVKKGVFLIVSASLLVAVYLLGLIILYSYSYASLLATSAPEAITPGQLRQLLLVVLTKPLSLFFLGLLLATWLFGVIDAGKTPAAPQEETK